MRSYLAKRATMEARVVMLQESRARLTERLKELMAGPERDRAEVREVEEKLGGVNKQIKGLNVALSRDHSFKSYISTPPAKRKPTPAKIHGGRMTDEDWFEFFSSLPGAPQSGEYGS